MPYLSKEPLYFLRTAISHYYEAGSGSHAVPKLYQYGPAKRVMDKKNQRPIHSMDGAWEMVPVTFVEGDPIKHD